MMGKVHPFTRVLRPSSFSTRRTSRRARGALAGALLLALGHLAAADSSPGTGARVGLQPQVRFERYSPLSTSAEIMRRLQSPLTQLRAAEEAERTGHTLQGQLVDLANEHFVLYVPRAQPPPERGYALLIFVPPWPEARIPPEWIPALEHHHMIMASAERSGNEASPLNRRVPLALLALYNLRAEFPIDANQTFVGGFSGGSRIALRLLVGYPDQFRGALLNAGSDAVGTPDLPLPPKDLLLQVQESTRLVYLTGERDEDHLIGDMNSRTSLKRWCIFNVLTLNEPRRDHEPADASAFTQALDALVPSPGQKSELKSCREDLDRRIGTETDRVAALFARADSHAHGALQSLDAKYGGLAAPRSVELARRP